MSDIVNLKISQHTVRELKKDISSMKKDMLKMIDAIGMNEMHIKQLNWKLNKIKGEKENDVHRKS